MPLLTLGPSPPLPSNEGYHSPHSQADRRSSSQERDDDEFNSSEFDPPAKAAEPLDDAPFATVVRADFSALSSLESQPAPAPASDGLPVDDVLGNLSQLLAAVQRQDPSSAREAAGALQFDLFSGAAALDPRPGGVADASMRLLDDLSDLIRAARLGDCEGAEAAARLLAADLKQALISDGALRPARYRLRPIVPDETACLVQGVNAAYERQMDADAAVGF